MSYEHTCEDIKTIISISKEPLVIRDVLKWDVLNWSLSDWKEKLGDEELLVRCGKNASTAEPQWERTTETMKCTFQSFLDHNDSNKDDWIYFDYKYLNENLFKLDDLRKCINWGSFGYPNLDYKDSTIWIGSKGAHTPCHIDTYGCNLIAQVYGRKEWFLCPPEQNLFPTRIPYEESSIYSKINFFSPNVRQVQHISKARNVVLEAGDVLYLPHGWWHYVENLETAISINVWIPQPEDDERRLEEALARLLVSHLIKDLPSSERSRILNPNMENDRIHEVSFTDAIQIIDHCINEVSKRRNSKKLRTNKNVEDHSQTHSGSSSLPDFIKTVPELRPEDIRKWADKQKCRFREQPTSAESVQSSGMKVIDAVLHPDVIAVIKSKLF